MANAKFGRVITAMITPFTADGEVDYEGAVTLAKHLVEHGSEGILVGGTTGEGATMTADEKLKLYAAVVNAVGRNASGKKVPVMGNLGGISTTESIASSKALTIARRSSPITWLATEITPTPPPARMGSVKESSPL